LGSFSNLDIWIQKKNSKPSLLSTVSQKSLFDIKKKRNSSIKNIREIEGRKSEQQSVLESKSFKKSGG
jgi:hypothetical protein